jgi:hypothetical protein
VKPNQPKSKGAGHAMSYAVRAIDQAGVLLRVEYFDDPIYADGCAAALHVQFLANVWVNETQVLVMKSHSFAFVLES